MEDDEGVEEVYDYSDNEEDMQGDEENGENEGEPKKDNGTSKKTTASKPAQERARRISYNETDGVFILTEVELKDLMDEQVEKVAELVQIPDEAALALLRYFNWNTEKLYEKYYADPESVTEKVGIEGASLQQSRTKTAGESFPCQICCETVDGGQALALPCSHYFCKICWHTYLKTKVEAGPTCVYTTCMAHKCPQIVSDTIFSENLTPAEYARYKKFSLISFVQINRTLRFCPGKACQKIAKAPIKCPNVKCDCGEVFCFRCGEEAHEPCSCDELAQWKERCQNESETANWILANTKKCPKCQTRIEKNQGCNHMTCASCKGEFCWICMGSWAEHGVGTGGYYKCNRYEAAVDGGKDEAARAKAELDRYLHYYQRYHNHGQGQVKALEQLKGNTEKRMEEMLQGKESGMWIDVQYISNAAEQLVECRRVLKYTYVLGFYLDTADTKARNLFEHHQENLEKFTEKLSELSETSIDKIDRAEVINYTRVTGNFVKAMLKACREGLGANSGDDENADWQLTGSA